MTKLTLIPILLVGLALIPAARALAHEGHEHKLMGIVSTVTENHLEVKATDGKPSLVTMNEKTRVVRGGAAGLSAGAWWRGTVGRQFAYLPPMAAQRSPISRKGLGCRSRPFISVCAGSSNAA